VEEKIEMKIGAARHELNISRKRTRVGDERELLIEHVLVKRHDSLAKATKQFETSRKRQE